MRPSVTELFRQLSNEREISPELLLAIRRSLGWELRRRGAGWGLLPRHLGCQWSEWSDLKLRGSAEKLLGSSGPLMDLALDCYEYAILQRFESLSEQLQDKENIDGLILLNIRNFLTYRQSKNDPRGARTYRNVKAAVEALILGKEVLAIGKGTKRWRLNRETLLTIPGEAVEGAEALEPLSKEVLRTWIMNEAMGRELVKRIGLESGEHFLAKLEEFIRDSRSSWIPVFFGDLVRVWKEEGRKALPGGERQHDLVVDQNEEGDASNGLVIRDEEKGFREVEQLLDTRASLRALHEAVEESGFQKRVRTRMKEVLDILEEILLAEGGDELPSQAELARKLGISTSSYSDTILRLRQLMEEKNSDEPQGELVR